MSEELNKNHAHSSVPSKNSEYYQLNNQQAQQQNLRGHNNTACDEKYDSGSQRQVYHNTQTSFNEQRQQYTHQAFNDYDAQEPVQQVQQKQQETPRQEQTVISGTQNYNYEEAFNPGDQITNEFQRYHYAQGENADTSQSNTAAKFLEEAALPFVANALQNKIKSSDYKSQKQEDMMFGTVETPDLMRNSQKIHKGRIRKDKIYGKLKEKKVKRIKLTYEGQRKRLQQLKAGKDSEDFDNKQNNRNDSRKRNEGKSEQERLKYEGYKKQRKTEEKGSIDNNVDSKADKTEESKQEDIDQEEGTEENLKNAGRKERIKHKRKKRLYDSHNIYDTSGAKDINQAVDEVLEKSKGRIINRHPQRDEKFQNYKKKITYLGRLKFERTKAKQKQTREEYEKEQKRKGNSKFAARMRGRLIISEGRKMIDDENIQEDEDIANLRRTIKRGVRTATYDTRRRVRSLKKMYNSYARLQHLNEREDYLLYKRKRLYTKSERQDNRKALREAATKRQYKKRKKEMAMIRAQKEGNFFQRVKNQFVMKKKADTYRKHIVKRTLATVSAVGGLLLILISAMLFVIVLIVGLTQGSVQTYVETVVQVDYGVMSDATAYYRRLETDLDEYLSDRETLEEELQEEYGPDIYEFIYDLADFGFSNNTLIAYLGAKYNDFTVDDIIRAELDSIFEEMYTLVIETKMEYRDVPDTSVTDPDTGGHPTIQELKKICYITLEKKELEDVVEPRLTEEQRKLYDGYRLSTGGQQMYGPVMQEDWTNKISSNFGERIHPITKERKFHKGVDIAVPKGTKLYSAVDGTVTTAKYSDSAGNYVEIQNATGWTVTFMHMDSFAVAQGQKIEKGDFVGYSGNTGNSTGPHLHLQVCNASGEPVNPIFIIPQNCHMVE